MVLTHFYNCLYFPSITGRISVPLYASYCVSKYGVEAFSDALRQEMQPWGMKVIVLEPGFFATKLSAPEALERDLRKGWDHINKDLKKDYGEGYLKRGTDSYPCNIILSYWRQIIGFLHQCIYYYSGFYTNPYHKKLHLFYFCLLCQSLPELSVVGYEQHLTCSKK